jgi:hypothetical protein
MKEKIIAFAWDIVIIGCLLACLLFVSGCFTKTVYPPYGAPVRLRQKVESVKIWVTDSKGKACPSVMDLPNGWFCGPLKPGK